MSTADDWDLLARAPVEERALRQLFERHRNYVYRVAWGLLNEEQLADDAVQEVFLKMRLGRLKAKPQAKFTTWLYQVALNTARELARSRRKMWSDQDAVRALEATADQTSDPARIDTLKDLGQALAALPGRQREVVVLRFLEGFDTGETAEILGCREGTVKAHLHRATQRLRHLLGTQVQKEKDDEETCNRDNDGSDSNARLAGIRR